MRVNLMRPCRLISAASLMCVVVLLASASGAWALVVPATTVTVGSADSGMLISWPAASEAQGYLVWRNTGEDPARSRVVGRVSASQTSFIDLTAAAEARYRYAVTVVVPGGGSGLLDASAWTAPSTVSRGAGKTSPHMGAVAGQRTVSCSHCHSISDIEKSTPFFLADMGRDDSTMSGLCLNCHEHSSSVGVQSVGVAFSTGRSGHSVVTSTTPEGSPLFDSDVSNCADCHDIHGSSASGEALKPKRVKAKGAIKDLAPSTNASCLACHDGAAEGELMAPSYDTSGYPVAGTFPGVDDAATPEVEVSNVHAAIQARGDYADTARPAGDCLWCHAAHASKAPYDGLLVVGDDDTLAIDGRSEVDVAPLCYECHTDVRDAEAASESMGHAVSTAGGYFEPGTALPCFVCHNSHGSVRGNALNLSDTLGSSLDPRSGAQGERRFCFTCHTDAAGLGWDSEAAGGAGAFVAVDPDATVVGLSRVATDTAGTAIPSKLRLGGIPLSEPATDPHSASYTGAQGCSDCHTSAHFPQLGDDLAQASCLDCHADLSVMDKASPDKTTVFHHVLGRSEAEYTAGVFMAQYDALRAQYPTERSKYCLSCHVDHITGDPVQQVLRTSASNATPASSDFGGSVSSPGLCLSCHTRVMSRNGTHQKDAKVRVPGGGSITSIRAVDATLFAQSDHNYDVLTHTGNSGNCVKCHNDASSVGGSTLADFSVHKSPNQSLISRMGDESDPVSWNAVPAQYKLCYQCHARYGEVSASTDIGKDFLNKDWFGAKTMGSQTKTYSRGGITIGTRTIDHQATLSDMFRVGIGALDLSEQVPESQMATSGHRAENTFDKNAYVLRDWYRTSTTAVRCTDCHDVHATTAGVMATGQEWPLTKKSLPPSGNAFAGNATMRTRIQTKGTDDAGNRLITLNDVFYRDQVRSELEATGKFTAEEFDRGLVSRQMVIDRGLGTVLADKWDSTVTVFCFQCHSREALTAKNHAADLGGSGPGGATVNHRNGLLPCTACHVPAVHGSGMPALLADMGSATGAAVMPVHQSIRWYDHYTDTYNTPIASLWSVKMTDLDGKKPQGCATPSTRCHNAFPGGWKVEGNQTSTGWSNWVSSF